MVVAKYQYGDWLRAPVKKRYEATIQPKGRILFHEEGGSSNSHSGYTTLGDDHHLGTKVPFTRQSDPINTVHVQPSAPVNSIPAAGTVLHSSPPMDAAALDATSHVLAADPVTVDDEEDVLVHGGAAVVDIVSSDVLAVDTMGTVHVSNHDILEDENDVLVTHSSHLEIASVKVASNFETIDEWFAEDDASTVPVVVEPPL
ncbi:hypothetical protein V6N12_020303 [Hibiscus sabdariffa]|uniref:Uncharacterized protein n=1 Tax=Hibiscus sabdariffa TaxID=183260 RepID=A0ABR2BUK3_9ROSI